MEDKENGIHIYEIPRLRVQPADKRTVLPPLQVPAFLRKTKRSSENQSPLQKENMDEK